MPENAKNFKINSELQNEMNKKLETEPDCRRTLSGRDQSKNTDLPCKST